MTSGKYLSINLKSFLLYPLGTLKKLRKAKLRVVYTPSTIFSTPMFISIPLLTETHFKGEVWS